MNSGQVLQKARVAGFDGGQRVEDHFVDTTEMVPLSGQRGPRRLNVKCAGVASVFFKD